MKIVPFEWHNLFITVFFLYIRSFQLALALQRQKVEAKVFDNLANHIHLDVAGISLVVEQLLGFSIEITRGFHFG